ncbi:NADPH:quinone reductase-like Zn-dependent oxidoreductase [Rubricella aquisinus]|uniref:NADPH:quinone reductase-like Zn-dependent oxidoreductase n=1 Tax=Rubricella aquisinus TaxID=2028108 RepID=A0A840X1Y3_9RHOB|nr:NAD(P)-dependent alcohol dehydrogenase [Rubricella aquisinus]MBB5515895.1 NADPH:quinone reductase-like Zn-dependent oxidoreductase [Rubricella aquisinus]
MTETLTAWQIRAYGTADQLTQIERPLPELKANDVLIKVRASAVTRADSMMLAGTPRFARLFLGLRRPKQDLIGTCYAGEVMAFGSQVTHLRVGDPVFGEAGLRFGANATHLLVDSDGVMLPKPAGLPFEEAATLCDGALTSLNFLQNVAQLTKRQRCLIIGASGGLGTAAVQIAKAMGAEVTAVCGPRNLDLVMGLGADHVVDYTRHPVDQITGPFDVIFDTTGRYPFARMRTALTPKGRYVSPVLTLGLLRAMLVTRMIGRRRALFSATGMKPAAELRPMLAQVLTLIAEEKLTPIIDRTYPLADLPEAQRRVATGHKRGNIVLCT